MHTGTSTPSARRRRTTVTPSRSGIVTSRTTAEGGMRPMASRASTPPAAVATAKPSRRRARSRACRTGASSSTTRTRGSRAVTRRHLSTSLRLLPRRRVHFRRQRVLHLLDGDAQLVRQLGCEPLPTRLHLRLELRAHLVEGRAHVARLHAERLGQLVEEHRRRTGLEAKPEAGPAAGRRAAGRRAAGRRTEPGAAARRTEPGAAALEEAHARVSARRTGKRWGAAHRPTRTNLLERGTELGLVDAELAGQGAEEVWGPHRVERALHLGRVDAERAREPSGERVAPCSVSRPMLRLKLGQGVLDPRERQAELAR